MILKLKRLDGDYVNYGYDIFNYFYINTKNIYSIEFYQDEDYKGLLINNKRYPLYDFHQSHRGTEKANNEEEKEEIIEQNWENGDKYVNNILNKIIEIMKTEQ